MSLFHFLRPEWFFAVIPLLLFYWLLTRMQLQSKSWQSFCDQALLPHLFNQSQVKKQKRPLFLLLLAGLLAITALAGPSWEKRPQPVFKKQSALVIMLDLSRSMDATDIKPSRLKRALHKIDDILKQRKEGQTALIVFAADAFTVTPLTEDTQTISSQIKSLSTQIMPGQGSRSDKAIKLAHALFKQSSLLKGHMLLITDGMTKSSADAIKGELSSNYSLSILGVGTEDGAPIPAAEGGFFKDHSGAIVIPKLNSTVLAEIAGFNSYRQLSTDDSDISHLLRPLDTAHDPDQTESTELNTDSWFEAGPWLLLALLPLAAFAFRKGYLFALLVLVLPHSDPGYAFEFSQLWNNNNQQAQTLLNENQPEQAAEKFTDPNWKAAAEYKSGQYQKALKSYQQLDQSNPETLYNLANTQAQLGQYDKALENYNKVIEKNPNHSDAKYNRDQIEKLQQQSQQQDNNKKDSDKNKDNKNKEQKSDQPSDNDTDKDGKPSDDENSANDDKKQNNNSDTEKDKKSEQNNQDDKSQQQNQLDKEKPDDKDKKMQPSNTDQSLSKEQQQANEQWLRRIPDDPGGLLKRKFRYQSQQRQNSDSGEQQW